MPALTTSNDPKNVPIKATTPPPISGAIERKVSMKLAATFDANIQDGGIEQ